MCVSLFVCVCVCVCVCVLVLCKVHPGVSSSCDVTGRLKAHSWEGEIATWMCMCARQSVCKLSQHSLHSRCVLR